MLNYKECSFEDFKSAMSKKNDDVKTLTNEELYILQTKFEHDAFVCGTARTLYGNDLADSSSNYAKKYEEELKRRNL